jgi:hypothetical protein
MKKKKIRKDPSFETVEMKLMATNFILDLKMVEVKQMNDE